MSPMTVVEPLSHSLRMHDWGLIDYSITFDRMRQFTAERLVHTPDELWVCQHAPVFTQGLAGKTAHVLCPGDIPVLATDRGGQVTFHGPGQVVVYPLIDLRRAGYFVKEYVYRLEESVIRTLMHLGVTGHRVAGAPGIYVVLDDPCGHTRHSGPPNSVDSAQPPAFEGLGKIAALGIKVSRHCTYHGASLNVDMDLEPFTRIHPCGYSGLQTVDLSTIGVSVHPDEVRTLWMAELNRLFAPHHPGT